MKIGNQARMVPLTTAFQYHSGVPTNAICQENKLKYIQIGKGEIKFLFISYMITSVEKPKELVIKKFITNTQLHQYCGP